MSIKVKCSKKYEWCEKFCLLGTLMQPFFYGQTFPPLVSWTGQLFNIRFATYDGIAFTANAI